MITVLKKIQALTKSSNLSSNLNETKILNILHAYNLHNIIFNFHEARNIYM